jgi:hypothetical protein
MLRDTYLRITRLEVPPRTTAASLRLLALVCRPMLIVEGYLLADIRVDAPIHFRAFFHCGRPILRDYASSDVVKVQGLYVMTDHSLYQVLRVPPYSRKRRSHGPLT